MILVFALLYKQFYGEEDLPLITIYFVCGLTYAGVTASCVMFMMTEEKEKNTLRGLVMSPMTFLDIIIGKSLVTTVITIVTLIGSFAIVGFEHLLDVQIIIGQLFLLLFFLFLGIFIGLISSSTAVTVAYNMPIVFIFGLTPFFQIIGIENEVFQKIIDAFPLPLLIQVHDSESWLTLGYLFIWVIAALLICFLAYKRVLRTR